MQKFFSTIATIWRLSLPYFRSEDRWPARILLAAVVTLELSGVAIHVILNQWYNRFYNTLQDRDWNAFLSAILFFCGLVSVYIVIVVYQVYLNQWLQIRWRRWMTQNYLRHWLNAANHYRMQLLGDDADNPDQRIAEDLQLFVQFTLSISIGVLNSVVTLGSFIVILWSLSARAPLHLFGSTVNIPGYLVWAALIYAAIGTTLTHLIGRRLIPLNFQQQRFEADFRFNLVRMRENSEQVAALGGEPAEREGHLNRFGLVVGTWFALMQRTKLLSFFTHSYAQASVIFPYIVVSPTYFSGAVQLGGLMQTASAFNSVQSALSYFISSYRSIAEWRAVVQRLTGFQEALAAGRAAAMTPPVIEVIPREGETALTIDDLNVRLPGGKLIVAADDLALRAGEHVLVTGPSGAGKSTLFRALAGIWPFGSGLVTVPKDAKVMLLPQRPYFPVGTLASAVSFPAKAGTLDHVRIAEALVAVGLPDLLGRLGEEAHWNRMLSLGEQQRLGIARVVLQPPDYLLLDEATASLDEAAEAALYRLVQERLKGTTIISIGHRSTLGAFHSRRIVLTAADKFDQARDVPLVSAAE